MWVLTWVEAGRHLHRIFAVRADADRHRQVVDHLDGQVMTAETFECMRHG